MGNFTVGNVLPYITIDRKRDYNKNDYNNKINYKIAFNLNLTDNQLKELNAIWSADSVQMHGISISINILKLDAEHAVLYFMTDKNDQALNIVPKTQFEKAIDGMLFESKSTKVSIGSQQRIMNKETLSSTITPHAIQNLLSQYHDYHKKRIAKDGLKDLKKVGGFMMIIMNIINWLHALVSPDFQKKTEEMRLEIEMQANEFIKNDGMIDVNKVILCGVMMKNNAKLTVHPNINTQVQFQDNQNIQYYQETAREADIYNFLYEEGRKKGCCFPNQKDIFLTKVACKIEKKQKAPAA